MKQTLRKCWAARLRNYNINYTNLIFDGVLDEVLDGRVNVPWSALHTSINANMQCNANTQDEINVEIFLVK